ncbi:hypothetical protein CXB49_06935 [Chromobacterium sp. ATCC 53434]|uniref:hypothetical protein n=1 Tax=Chromobacterium TaxID=535 RepID=UPI000C764B06|nr:hypothetical protein [Chromobacterium sp. ATCC 53434]AUH50558.1 hypothetical protein CXB49_06935 [Chromobacterium sp. ATCC 53434]
MSFFQKNQTLPRFKIYLAALLLLGSLPAYAGGAFGGAELAKRLSGLYQRAPSACDGANGLLLREAGALPVDGKTWYLNQASANPFTDKPGLVGLVLPMDANQHATLPDCALAGDPADGQRAAGGCWPAAEAGQAIDSDPSSCGKLMVKYGCDVTMDNWLKRRADGQPACSFSTRDQAEFKQALLTGAKLSVPLVLPMQEWRATDLKGMTTRAVVYAAGSESGRSAARSTRLALYNDWKLDIPVLAFDAPGHGFKYLDDDNPTPRRSGQTVVAELNRRFNNTVTDCGGKPAHHCSGLLVHMAAAGQYPVWDYKPHRDKAGISFVYLRRDTNSLLQNLGGLVGQQGVVFKSTDDQQQDGQNADFACLYPSDVDSNYAIDQPEQLFDPHTAFCTMNPRSPLKATISAYFNDHANPTDPSSCQDSKPLKTYLDQHGLTLDNATGPQLFDAWKESQRMDGHYRCSFSTRKANQFHAAILASPLYYYLNWNEGMVRSYPKAAADVAHLPIEAFFFMAGQSNAGAFTYQTQYMKATGVTQQLAPPVVKYDPTKADPFSLQEKP